MNKEHLESDLTIKASYKVGHILSWHTFKLPHVLSPGSRIYICMGEIKQESSTQNCNVLRALLYETRQLYFYIYMIMNSLNIIEKWHQRLGCTF